MFELPFPIWSNLDMHGASLVVQLVKNPPAMQGLGFNPWVEKIPWRRTWQPSILDGESPWIEEPGGLQSMGSQRVRHDWATEHTHIDVCAWVLSHFSHVWVFVALWTVALQAHLSMGILQARILGWVAMPFSRRSPQSMDQTRGSISCLASLQRISSTHGSNPWVWSLMYLMAPALVVRCFTTSATWEAL